MHAHAFSFDPIFVKLARKISNFEFRPDRTTPVGDGCPIASKKFPLDNVGKWCFQASTFIFDRITVKYAGN